MKMKEDHLTTAGGTLGATMTGVQRDPTTHDILVAARKLIEKPENWCQGDYAIDARGRAFSGAISLRDACRFCSIGAVAAVTQASVREVEDGDAIEALRLAMGIRVHRFNDRCSHAEVLAAFDKAIAIAKAAGSANGAS